MSVLEQQAALERDVQVARERVAEAEAQRTRARRAGQRALDEVRAYHEDVGAGRRDEDPAEEQRLVAAATAASATTRIVPVDAHGRAAGLELVDEALEGRLAGARQALQEAESALRTFERQHVWDLVEAAAPAMRDAHDGLLAVLQAADEAILEWDAAARQIAALGTRTGAFAAHDLPDSPITREAELAIAKVARNLRAGRPPAMPIPTRQGARDAA